MKKNKNHFLTFLKISFASFLLVFLAFLSFNNIKQTKAETIDLTYYSNQVLFIPPNAIDKVNFYTKVLATTTSAVNLGTLYIYSRYPYLPTIESTIYTYRKSTTNYNQNGLVYTGGGNFNYLTYTAGDYRVNNYIVDSYYPPLYIVIEFKDFTSVSSTTLLNTFVPNPNDLFSNGCMFLESGPSKENDYLFYAFLGGYLSNKDNQESYERGIDEVIKNHGDYGLYNRMEVQREKDQAYQAGLDASTSNYTTYSNLLSSVWNGTANILNIEILGKIKIIHCLAIPLLLGLFVIILKIIRG